MGGPGVGKKVVVEREVVTVVMATASATVVKTEET